MKKKTREKFEVINKKSLQFAVNASLGNLCRYVKCTF